MRLADIIIYFRKLGEEWKKVEDLEQTLVEA